jgi:hypothetical protein
MPLVFWRVPGNQQFRCIDSKGAHFALIHGRRSAETVRSDVILGHWLRREAFPVSAPGCSSHTRWVGWVGRATAASHVDAIRLKWVDGCPRSLLRVLPGPVFGQVQDQRPGVTRDPPSDVDHAWADGGGSGGGESGQRRGWRVRLCAIAMQVSQALSASNWPDGRWASGPSMSSASAAR